MKTKALSILLIILLVILCVLWNKERNRQNQLNIVEKEVKMLKTRIFLLELRAKILKVEIDMVKVSNYQETIKGWSNENKKKGG